MDIFDKAFEYTEAREAIRQGYYPYFIPMAESEGTEAVFHGHRLIMCGSNNYLGLTTDPSVRRAAIEAVERFGTSCTGSRFLNGTLELHERLEHELAEFVGKEAALVFSTGMQTNLGVLSAIVGRGDVIVLDKDDHASLVDGARLAWGETKRFKHNDMADLERVLSGIAKEKGRLVVVDGLYSMGGDLAPLPEITALCKKYGARLMVDDAHGMGVMGRGPRHGGALRRDRRGGPDHVHLQQVVRLAGRIHRRRRPGDPLHQASRPGADLQRQHPGGQRGRGAGRAADHARRAAAGRPA